VRTCMGLPLSTVACAVKGESERTQSSGLYTHFVLFFFSSFFSLGRVPSAWLYPYAMILAWPTIVLLSASDLRTRT
jgi:hypothetical protein